MTRKEEIEQAAEEYNKSMSWQWEAPNYPHKEAFIAGAEWGDRTILDRVCDFIKINAYKYRQLKFVKNKATFDFRTDRLIEDLRNTMWE